MTARHAAGAIGVLANRHADNQSTLIRCGAIPLLCAAIKEGQTLAAIEMMEESAGALWSLALDTTPQTKETIAAGGAIGLLMSMLTNLTTKKSADYAAGGLAALAEKCHENTKTIVQAQVAAIGTRASSISLSIRWVPGSRRAASAARAAG